MELMDAKEYDEAGARLRKKLIVGIVSTLLLVGLLVYQFRYWPEQRLVEQFFAALQKQNYETAYALYMVDPTWKQYSQQHSMSPYNEYYCDCGPCGVWGLTKSYNI